MSYLVTGLKIIEKVMQTITLQPIPNQSFSVRLDNSFYEFTIKETAGCMSLTLSRDNVILVEGLRIVAGTPLIPYNYLQKGNFLILTANDDLPFYDQFGITQNLYYVSPDEIEVYRGT